MDDYKEMMEWLLQNKKRLNLAVVHYDWAGGIWPDFIDLAVEIQLATGSYFGRGSSVSENQAFLSAAGEALERATFYNSEAMNTNGIALHDSIENASSAAILELLERDVILCHHLLRLPYDLVSEIVTARLNIITENFNKKYSRKIVFSFGKRSGQNGVIVCICAAHGLNHDIPFGVIIGAGCGFSENATAEKALVECILNTAGYLGKSEHKEMSIENFNSQTHHAPEHHDSIAVNPRYFEHYEYLFQDKFNSEFSQHLEYEGFRFEVDQLQPPHELKDIPAFVVQARCLALQNLWFGPSSLDSINIDRVSKVANKKVHQEELNLFPHPLG